MQAHCIANNPGLLIGIQLGHIILVSAAIRHPEQFR